MPNNLKRYNTHLSEKQIDELEELAGLTSLNKAAHIRLAVEQYLRRELRKARTERDAQREP
jgi:hypothetical protein